MTGALPPDTVDLVNGSSGRGSELALPAVFRVEQPSERQLASRVELPLLAYCVEKLVFSLRQTKATKIDFQKRSIFNDRWLGKGRVTPKNHQQIQEPSFSTQ